MCTEVRGRNKQGFVENWQAMKVKRKGIFVYSTNY